MAILRIGAPVFFFQMAPCIVFDIHSNIRLSLDIRNQDFKLAKPTQEIYFQLHEHEPNKSTAYYDKYVVMMMMMMNSTPSALRLTKRISPVIGTGNLKNIHLFFSSLSHNQVS